VYVHVCKRLHCTVFLKKKKVAHCLARFGFRCESECSGLVESAPHFVAEFVASDLAAQLC
jgi:hypothetical protein